MECKFWIWSHIVLEALAEAMLAWFKWNFQDNLVRYQSEFGILQTLFSDEPFIPKWQVQSVWKLITNPVKYVMIVGYVGSESYPRMGKGVENFLHSTTPFCAFYFIQRLIFSSLLYSITIFQIFYPFSRDKYKPEIMVPSRGKVIICGYYDETYFQSRYKWKETKYIIL